MITNGGSSQVNGIFIDHNYNIAHRLRVPSRVLWLFCDLGVMTPKGRSKCL